MASPYPGGFAPAGPQGPPFAARPTQPGTPLQPGYAQGSPYSGSPAMAGGSFQSPPNSAGAGVGVPQQAGPPGPSPRPLAGEGGPGSTQAPYGSSPQRPPGQYPPGAPLQGGDAFAGRPAGPPGGARPYGPALTRPAFPGPQGGGPRPPGGHGFGGGPQFSGQLRPAGAGPGPVPGSGQFAQQHPGVVRPPGMPGMAGSSGAPPAVQQAGFPGQRPAQGPLPPQAGPASSGPVYGARPSGPPAPGQPYPGQQPGYGAPGNQVAGQFQNLQIGTGSPSATAQHPLGAGSSAGGPPRRVYPQAYTTGGAGQQPPNFAAPPGPTSLAPPAQPRMASQPRTPPSHIDPTQIPRPQPTDAIATFETRVSGTANLPPPATSSYLVRDTGNCSPRVMRATLNQVPAGEELVKVAGMPLALLVQPLALADPREEALPLVDAGEAGPVRCGRCKAYMNPFMTFVDQGRHFTCNFCNMKNETPRHYMMNLGPDGRRRDVLERPELCRGSVEFVATAEYMVRPPMPHTLLFLIDVSLNAVTTGSTAAACSAVARAVADLPDVDTTRVGVATYDSTIHFYNISPSLAQPQMLIVPDVKEPYTPLPAGLAVPLPAARQHLSSLLDSLPSMFQSNRVGDSAMGSAVKAAVLALKATGGKLLVFQAVLPSLGIGCLSGREAEGRAGPAVGEKEVNKLLQPADKSLEKLAMEAAEFQVAVDVFVTAQGYVDVASLSVLPRLTGGSLCSYQPFNAAVDSAKLFNDLRWNLTRPQGLEAVMRVRCSQGLQVADYSGHFCRRIPTDVDLPAVDCDKAVLVTLRHEEKLPETQEAAFQCALLYTTLTGQRRIRVHTLSLPVTTALGNLFRGADLDAHFAYFLKTAAADVPRLPVAQIRDQITAATVSILYAYRKHCATSSSAGQLILPEALKLLPLYALALTKSPGLRSDVRVDERAAWLAKVAALPAPLAVPLVYPRMFALHTLQQESGAGAALLPAVVGLSSEKLEAEGVYLLENGEDAFLWAGKAAAPELLAALFGVRSLDQVAPGQLQLQRLDNPLSLRLNDMVDEIRRQRCSYLRLRILKRGDPLEPAFFQSLVEDKAQYGQSYVEYLIHIHRQIQNRFN